MCRHVALNYDALTCCLAGGPLHLKLMWLKSCIRFGSTLITQSHFSSRSVTVLACINPFWLTVRNDSGSSNLTVGGVAKRLAWDRMLCAGTHPYSRTTQSLRPVAFIGLFQDGAPETQGGRGFWEAAAPARPTDERRAMQRRGCKVLSVASQGVVKMHALLCTWPARRQDDEEKRDGRSDDAAVRRLG